MYSLFILLHVLIIHSLICFLINTIYLFICGPRSSVGIATDYVLDVPGIESRWGEIFHLPDRP